MVVQSGEHNHGQRDAEQYEKGQKTPADGCQLTRSHISSQKESGRHANAKEYESTQPTLSRGSKTGTHQTPDSYATRHWRLGGRRHINHGSTSHYHHTLRGRALICIPLWFAVVILVLASRSKAQPEAKHEQGGALRVPVKKTLRRIAVPSTAYSVGVPNGWRIRTRKRSVSLTSRDEHVVLLLLSADPFANPKDVRRRLRRHLSAVLADAKLSTPRRIRFRAGLEQTDQTETDNKKSSTTTWVEGYAAEAVGNRLDGERTRIEAGLLVLSNRGTGRVPKKHARWLLFIGLSDPGAAVHHRDTIGMVVGSLRTKKR